MRLNIHGLIAPAKCYQMVRQLRWADGVVCPASRVEPGCYIGKTNVNCREFGAFLNDIANDKRPSYVNMNFENRKQFNKEDSGIRIVCDDSDPVETVSWLGAVAFCDWLSESSGMTFRLPTEAEWEYAARGHNNTYDATWDGRIGYSSPSPTPPNGIRNMATGYLGNWVQDHFDLFTTAPKIDPKGPDSTPQKYLGNASESRVLRRPLFSITGRSPGYNARNDASIYGCRVALDEECIAKWLKDSTSIPKNVSIVVTD